MSNDGIEPDELWAQTTAIAVTPTSSGSSQRQLIIIGAVAFVAMFVVGLVLTLVLGSDDPTTSVATTTTSTLSTTTTSTPAIVGPTSTQPSIETTAPVATTTETTTETTVESTTTTMATLPVSQAITVAGPSGIVHITGSQTQVFDSQTWALAFRLSDGSYIAQPVWPGYQQPGDNTIYRVGETTSVVVSATNPDAEWLRLHDVFSEGGSTFAVYSVKRGVGLEAAQEELFVVDLASGKKTSYGIIGDWITGPSKLTYGSGIIVGEFFTETTAGPFFLTLDGYSINPNDFGLAESYDNCDVCPSHFTVDPSGQRIAWVEADLLVVLDRQSTRRVAEVRLPQGLYTDIDSLDLLGDLILINAYDRSTGVLGKPILMSFAGTSTTLGGYGTATFDQ